MIHWKAAFKPGLFQSRAGSQVVRPWRTAGLLGGTYIIVAGLYIIGSSQYVAHRAASIQALQLSELEKGLIFVLITGIGLILLTRGLLLQVAANQAKILEQRNALLVSERHAVAGILASSVAHDMNNVLTTLASTVEMLSLEMVDVNSAQDRIKQVRKANYQLAELTERLLRARKSHPMGTLHSISLHVLADEALAFAKSHPDVRNCKIQVHCPASIELTGYPDLLRQALFNLLLNAAQATAGRGSIFLEVSRDQDHIRLVVADDGPGIPEADREKIFEPFYTTKPQGTGLGMLSIQACVESHHGEIVVGESIQGGAQFTLRFPIIGT